MGLKKYFKADVFWEYVLSSIPIIRTNCAVAVADNILLGSQNGFTSAAEVDLILLVNAANYYRVDGSTTIQKISAVDITGGTEIRLLLPAAVTVNNNVANNGDYKGIKLASAANYTSSKLHMLRLIYDSVDDCWYECGRTEYS